MTEPLYPEYEARAQAPIVAPTPQGPTDAELFAEKNADTLGFLDLVWRSAATEGYTGTIARSLSNIFRVDDGYSADRDWQELTKDIPPQWHTEFAFAVNRDHAFAMRESILSRLDKQRELQEGGWKATPARLLAGVLDPAAIAVTVGTSGLAAEAFGVTRAFTLANAAKAGLINAAQMAPLEVYRAANDPDYNVADVALSTASNTILGGLFHGGGSYLSARKLAHVEKVNGILNSMAREAQAQNVAKSGAPLTPKGVKNLATPKGDMPAVAVSGELPGFRAELDAARDAAAARIKARGGLLRANIDPDDLKDVAIVGAVEIAKGATDKDNWAKLMLNQFGDAIKDDMDDIWTRANSDYAASIPPRYVEDVVLSQILESYKSADAGPAALSKFRFSAQGRVGASKLAATRWLGRVMAKEVLPDVDGNPVLMSRSELKHWMASRTAYEFYSDYNPAFDSWRKRTGRSGPLGLVRDYDDFRRAIADAKRSPDPIDDPDILRVTRRMDAIYEKHRQLARRFGVKNFDQIEANAQYLNRLWSVRSWDNAIAAHGDDAVYRMVANAIKAKSPRWIEAIADDLKIKNPGMDDAALTLKAGQRLDKLTLRMAKAIHQRTAQKGAGLGIHNGNMFTEAEGDMLEAVLREELHMADDEIQNILSKTVGDTRRGVGESRQRIQLDEQHAESVQLLSGGSKTLTISDLLENNVEFLTQRYARHVSAAIGEQQMLDAFNARHNTTVDTWLGVKAFLEKEGLELAPDERPKAMRDIRRLDILHRVLMDEPVGPLDRDASGWLRNLMKYNYVRVGNRFGLSQFAEYLSIGNEIGWRAMIQSSPGLRGFLRKAKYGMIDSETLLEIQAMFGEGTDVMSHRLGSQYRGGAADFASSFEGRVGGALSEAGSVTNFVSGMSTVDAHQRIWATRAAIQRFTQDAFSSKTPSKLRLAYLGLSQDDFTRIAAQLKEHASLSEGALGKKYRLVNLENWTDQGAAAKFVVGVNKWASHAIQRNDPGMLMAWMNGDLAKMLIQFRSFTIGAYENHLLHAARMADARAATSILTGMFGGGLVYVAIQYQNSIGRADREEYLAKRLSARGIAGGAFQRSAFSSILPGTLQPVLRSLDFDIFSPDARTTGSGVAIGADNPTVQGLFNIGQAASGATRAAIHDDYEFSQKEWRDAISILPYANLYFLGNALQSIGNNLPKTSRRTAEDF